MSALKLDENGRLEHYVSPAPFEPQATETLTPEQEAFYRASQWRIMWWKFRRHRIAVVSAAILALLYLSSLVSEVLAPYGLNTRDSGHIYAPPQVVGLFHEGEFVGPFVYGYSVKLNMETMKREFVADPQKVQPLRFFCRGDDYEFWGLIEGDFHLVCPAENGTLYLLGTDRLGRDMLSRIIYGARTALGVAITATGIAGILGILLGLVAGYGPRWLDSLLILCFDATTSLPMIMFALAVITVVGPGTPTLILVIVLVSIPVYARLIRTQTLGLKTADFILAERAMGASPLRILLWHLLPNVVGPLVIILSMDIPVVIMLEAGLSYLNLGVKPPVPSWGNILYDGYTSLRQSPVMVIAAGIPLILATIGFTFLGEGLRDALDPRLQVRPR